MLFRSEGVAGYCELLLAITRSLPWKHSRFEILPAHTHAEVSGCHRSLKFWMTNWIFHGSKGLKSIQIFSEKCWDFVPLAPMHIQYMHVWKWQNLHLWFLAYWHNIKTAGDMTLAVGPTYSKKRLRKIRTCEKFVAIFGFLILEKRWQSIKGLENLNYLTWMWQPRTFSTCITIFYCGPAKKCPPMLVHIHIDTSVWCIILVSLAKSNFHSKNELGFWMQYVSILLRSMKF